MKKTRFVEVGSWRTLERFWGRQGRAVFVGPVRAEIKVRYGNGRNLGKDLQRRTLDGLHARELKVGLWSLVYARMQILVLRSTNVTYDFYPGRYVHAEHGATLQAPRHNPAPRPPIT